MSKAKTAMVFLSLAIAMLFLLRTLYIRVMNSSGTVSLVVAINIIILFLFFHYRRNPDQLLHPQPLFSFPSLSRQTRYRPLVENNGDLPEPVVNVNEPAIVPPHLEPDVVSDIRSSDGVVWERGESSSRISSGSQEQELSDLAGDRADDDDQGSNGTLDEMWNNIVATGKAKPVRLFTSSQREGNPKRETRKSTTTKRKEKKKPTESTSYNSVERRTRDRSMEAATGISRDELAHLSETFIKRHYNKLIIERQESDQRRIEERLGLRHYRNAVSV